MKKAVKLDATDNVMTCTSEIFSGEFVESAGITGDTVQSVENIPAWHKIALRDIRKGEKIFKYGEIIGETNSDIPKGGLVSHENIFSVPRDYAGEYVKE